MESANVTVTEGALLDHPLAGCHGDAKELLGRDGLLRRLQKRLVERVLDCEMEAHLDAVRGAAERTLEAEIKVQVPNLVQVGSHNGAERDPRGWSLSTLFHMLLPSDWVQAVAGAKTEAIDWADPLRWGGT